MSDDDGVLEIARDGAVAIATMNRPPANALTAEFMRRIEAGFAELAEDLSVRAVVLTGAGKAFCAGMDLKRLPDLDQAAQADVVDALNSSYGALYAFPKPLIAAVNGPAIAGGLFWALVADWRVGALGGTRFGLTEVRVGLPFPVGPLEIAKAELPPPVARRLLLGGGLIGVDEALAAGVLDETAAPDALIERAVQIARERAESPAPGYAAVKAQLRKPVLDRIRETLAKGDDPHRAPWFLSDPTEPIARILQRAR